MNDDNKLKIPDGDFDYYSLVRKSDNKEVYSSPYYFKEHSFEADLKPVKANLQFYFDRVNSGIEAQLQSPRLTEEQKKELKLLEKKDYVVKLKTYVNIGIAEKVKWTEEAESFFKVQ